ncbi:MAG: hypothetical protein ACKVYV_07705 [Limisphaerales bacterium]
MERGPDLRAENEIAALFRLPLEAFTQARNDLAASLKKQGLAEESTRVKALPKPPASVWAVNQLHWQRTPVLDQLIAAGDRFRQAQTARLSGVGPDLRASFDERRDALALAVSTAAGILTASGHPPTPDVLRRITTTLEAVATFGTTAFAPPRGRLIADLAPQGFEALSALIPRGSSASQRDDAPSEVVPFGPRSARTPHEPVKGAAPPDAAANDRAERAAVAKGVREAERNLARAQTALKQAEAAMKAAAARSKAAVRARAAVERIKATVDRRHAAAAGKADAAVALAHAKARAAEDAADALLAAERGLRLARDRAAGQT